MVRPAIVVLGISALPLAQMLKLELEGEIHTPVCVAGGDVSFPKASEHLSQLFADGRTIVGLCASGILIRAIAPRLKDKRTEPPVIAVAEDGSSAVPLLGGHHGANELARKVAKLTGGSAAITTASDLRLGSAFDEPAPGYFLANFDDAKAAAAAVIAGSPIALFPHPGESRESLNPFPQLEMAQWSSAFAGVTLKVTERVERGSTRELIYHPQTLAVGIGCERGTKPAEVEDLIAATLANNNFARNSVAYIGTIDVKQDEPALRQYGRWVRYFSADELRNETPRIKSPSAIVEEEVGTPSVAEAAALALAGRDCELVVTKTKSARATCAIARASRPIIAPAGREAGSLAIVGIGPGDRMSLTPAALSALEQASDWVGYGLYLDLVEGRRGNQTPHPFPLGAEEERVRHAIELAKQGRHVALVCSGDAGIYAMAALVYEIVDLEPSRIAVDVIPGISAFQAAAAKAGAMIGHDFCCISLSDLLTPWEVIEKRVTAAAEGDFIVSFYNPRSQKRRDQLERAFAILRRHRPPDTPVVIASNLGRPEENVRIVRFAGFNPEDVDMLTLVMVGSSQSKSFVRGDGRTCAYTPRGYAKKRESAQ